MVKDASAAEKEDVYLGKKVAVKLFEQTAKLMRCFDEPDKCLDVVQTVQDELLKLVPLDPRGRQMFDFEVEDTRDVLALQEEADAALEGKEQAKEEEKDFRPPSELIEEFMQTLVLLIERQPAASSKVLRLMVLCLSLENEGLSDRALEQLLDFLEAGGSYSELVVGTLMSTLIPQLTDAKIPEHSRDLLLNALHQLAEDGEGVKEGMRPLAPTLAQWLGHASPSESVLSVIASACRDTKTVLELREERLAKRVISLVQSREARKWPRSRRIQLLRIAEWSARNDERTSHEYSKANVHTELLQELSGAVSTPGQFNDAKSDWVTQLVATLDGLNLHSKATRETTTKAGFVDRLLRVVAGQLNIRAPLLTACLNALVESLNHADVLLAKKITYGLGGVVPLMQYISGRKYEQLAEQCGEEDENGVVPLKLLRNRQMMDAISAVCCVVRCYCVRANEGDSDAMDTCNKLDAAGREQVLFKAFEVPDDDLRVVVMECLLEVPVSNLQAEEVQNIVAIIANCDNLTVGRTEQIIGYAFQILRKLVVDDGEEGIHFRRFHAATIHMALDIIVRNSGRDTRENRVESEEKTVLSTACVDFLRAASFEWAEAIELMQTRNAVEAMMTFMKNEEMYGREDMPVWVERTAVGSSVQALLQCLPQLRIEGSIVGRLMTRMAEVLEGRHTDEEIADTNVQQLRDFAAAGETSEQQKRRIAQHSLFVQVDGPGELLRYLMMHIQISPTDYAPSGAGARILHWASARQREVDAQMMGLNEHAMELPDIKLEGYEYLFTEELHRLQDVETAAEGAAAEKKIDAELDTATGEGVAVAAAFRVLLALLRYGTTNTKSAVLQQLRDRELLRSMICLASEITSERWYPDNVGTNLLLIMQDLCLLPLSHLHEEVDMVELYDMIALVTQSCLKLLEPKMQAVIANAQIQNAQPRPMSAAEELLLYNVAQTYRVVCETVITMQLAEDDEVRHAAHELALQCLLPVPQMRVLIKFLYYDTVLSYESWLKSKEAQEEAEAARAKTAHVITLLLAEHLSANEDTRWELLEVFARYEIAGKLALRPSFVQTLLQLVQHRLYERALEPHLAKRKIFPEPERVLVASWVRLEPLNKRRLLIVTNRAWYMLKMPTGKRCTACDAHKFCPAGPTLVQRFAFRDVHQLTLGYGPGQRACIAWSKQRVTIQNPAKTVTFSVTQLNVVDKILRCINTLYPLARPPPIDADMQTSRVIRSKLLVPDEETVHLHILLERIDMAKGTVLPRAATLSDTTLYIFVEDPNFFLVEPLLTAKEKRGKRKDGGRLLREDEKWRWEHLLEVDFLARDQSVVSLRFSNGSTQLRFGDDFGLSLFKFYLRKLLPEGLTQWRRNFGNPTAETAAAARAAAGGAEDEGEEGEEGEGGEEEGEEGSEHEEGEAG